MKTIRGMALALAMGLMTASPALAVDTHKVYSSGALVLVFLGFCALVVVAQLIPAIITLIGMVKGYSGSRETASETAGIRR